MEADSGTWTALPRILYGFAIFPFTPLHDDQHPYNPFQVPLEIGSELYVFEVYRPHASTSYNDEGLLWYRGYVVASRQTGPALGPAFDHEAGAATEEPSVTIGIFPATHCLIKERLEDDDQRLGEVRAQQGGAFAGPSGSHNARDRAREPLEPLMEADDEGDLFGNLISTPSKAKNRASVPDGRLSGAYSASAIGQSSAGETGSASLIKRHHRTPSVASAAEPRSFEDDIGSEQHDSPADDTRPPPPLPSLKTGDETASGMEEPLIDEIACAMREWGALLRVYLHKRDYRMFHAVKAHIDYIHLGRRQLLSQTLSMDEVSRLRTDLVQRLVQGNLMQELDIVVRHPSWGGMADVETHAEVDMRAWMSGVRMFRMGVELAYSGANEDQDPSTPVLGSPSTPVLGSATKEGRGGVSKPSTHTGGGHSVLGPSDLQSLNSAASLRKSPSNPLLPSGETSGGVTHPQLYHVFIDMKAFFASVCQPGEMVELYFSLFNKSDNRFLTEECCIILNHNGVPLDGRLDTARALFKDMSQQDVLDTLVLVCKIVINGKLRSYLSSSSSASQRGSFLSYNAPYSASTASFLSPAMSSLSVATEHKHSRSFSNGTSNMGLENSMTHAMPPDSVNAPVQRSARRAFGCAVVEISHFVKIGQSTSTAFTEVNMPIFTPSHNASFSTLHEDIIASRTREFEKPSTAEHITIGLKVFHDDVRAVLRDNPSLMKEAALTARLGFGDVVFPDDQRNDVYIKLWNGDFPSLTSGSSKLARVQVNVEVEAEVRLSSGMTLPNAISRGSGEASVTRYTSTIFRNNSTPTWGELVKLDIAFDQILDCHIFFTFRNRRERNTGVRDLPGSPPSAGSLSDKSFAFAFLPLIGTDHIILGDGGHRLILYRYEQQAIPAATYLQAPAIYSEGSSISLPPSLQKMLVPLRDTMTIRSFLCSTRLTQDPTILALLNWETSLAEHDKLQDNLKKLRYSPEFECVKMITHIFDCLFAILASARNANGEFDNGVCQALVSLLGLVSDRRFLNFKPVLEVYIEKYFSSSTAFTHIIRSLRRLIIDYANPESAQDLRSSIKVWAHLFKLIAKSRQLQRAKEEDTNFTANHLEAAFKQELKTLLQSINTMMFAIRPPSVVGTQTLAIQHFASIIPELSRCFSSEEIANIAIGFCDSIQATKGSMIVHKIVLLAQLSNGPLAQESEQRAIMIPNICRWLKPHLGGFDELKAFSANDTQATKDSLRVAWLEAMRLAVAAVAALLDRLHAAIVESAVQKQSSALAQDEDSIEFVLSLLPRLLDSYSDLDAPANLEALQRHRSAVTGIARHPTVFPSSSPTPLLVESPTGTTDSPASRLKHFKSEIAAVIVVLVHVSSPAVLASYLQTCFDVENQDSFASFLSNLFQTFRSFLQFAAYPSTWVNINMLAHKATLRIAHPASFILIRHLVPPQNMATAFRSSLWAAFFDMILALLSSPSLLIEEFSPARQRAVWRLAGDIRGEGSKIWLRSWEALSWPDANDFSSPIRHGGYQFRLTKMVERVVELCLSHHDELRTTAVKILYTLIISEFRLHNSFQAIENGVMDRLDKLFSHRKGDEISRAFFVTQLRNLFQTTKMDTQLRDEVDSFLDSIDQFLQLLLGIRNLPESEEWQDDRVIGTLRLMAFIEKRHRSIFIRYVHRLVDYHIASNHFTEAGLTLRLHADLYSFDPTAVVLAMDELSLPRQSEYERKEVLYLRMLELLSRGKAYEAAIATSKILQEQYEQNTFAYQRLSELLTHQADLYASIVTQPRHYPHAYRVAFLGRGFPASVQDKHFVYRGLEWENYSSFCERMSHKHPGAQIVRSEIMPEVDLDGNNDRFLLITPIVPEPDRTLAVFTSPGVPQAVREYYEHNETRLFSFTRKLNRAEGAVLNVADTAGILVWTEKTYLTCAESFPTILHRTEVLEIHTTEASPLENALEQVQAETGDLYQLQRRYQLSNHNKQDKTAQQNAVINCNPLSMALNKALDTGSGGIPLFKRAFFDSSFIAANADKLHTVEQLRSAIDEQVRLLASCLKLHQSLCPPDMHAFDLTLVGFFERNYAEEIARLSPDLEYRDSQAAATRSPALSRSNAYPSVHSSSTSENRHTGNSFNGTPLFQTAPHQLPFTLPPISNFDTSTSEYPSFNTLRSASRSSAMYTYAPLEGPPTQPKTPQTNGVHFAPETAGSISGRLSPALSTTASTMNSTVASGRPPSILSRLSSFRRKK